MKRALVVDDNEQVLDIMAASIRHVGNFGRVDQLIDAESALEIFEPGKYDLIVLDIGLIVMSGVDAAVKIRALDSKVKLVAVTGHSLIIEKGNLAVAGFDAWFAKPFGYYDFLDFISNI